MDSVRERCLRVPIFMRNMRDCSKKDLTSDRLSTIYNEHMFKINGEGAMTMVTVFIKYHLSGQVRRTAPDSGGNGR